MSTTPDLFYLIIACLVLASIFLLVAGLTGIKLFTKIVEIPKGTGSHRGNGPLLCRPSYYYHVHVVYRGNQPLVR